jgi:hypothetical protein
MRAGPFLSAVAAGLGVEAKTVRVFARELRLAGLLSTGARGVNAPDMTIEDLAKLIVAFLATDRPSKAVEMLQHFGAMQLSEHTEVAPAKGMPSNASHTFLELMELWCDPAVAIPPGGWIEASGTSGVRVVNEGLETSGAGGTTFSYSSRAEEGRLRDAGGSGLSPARGLIVSRSISSTDLSEIKASVFGHVAQNAIEER